MTPATWVTISVVLTGCLVLLVLWVCRRLTLLNFQIARLDVIVSRSLRRRDRRMDQVEARVDMIHGWATRTGAKDEGGVA